MPGQGVIVGVGSLDYPTEWKAADPVTLADLGVSKVITISSTYDHRIIQGAESGLFLKRVEELLLGVDGFYDEVFRALGVPYEAVQWRRDVNPIDREQAMLEKQMAVANLIRVHRVRGHLIADLDPLRWKEPADAGRARPGHLRAHDLGPRPRVPHRRAGGPGAHGARRHPPRAARRLLPHDRHRVHAHPGSGGAALDPGAGRGRVARARPRRPALHPRAAQRRGGLREVPRHEVRRARSGSGSRGRSRPSRSSTRSSSAPPTPELDGTVIGMPHRGRLNVLTNIVGKSYDQIFKEFEGQVDPDSMQGSGDVKYHLGQTGKFVARSGKDITGRAGRQPQPPRGRRPGGRGHGAGQAGRHQRSRRRSRSCRSSCTATPRSPARAWWRRRST